MNPTHPQLTPDSITTTSTQQQNLAAPTNNYDSSTNNNHLITASFPHNQYQQATCLPSELVSLSAAAASQHPLAGSSAGKQTALPPRRGATQTCHFTHIPPQSASAESHCTYQNASHPPSLQPHRIPGHLTFCFIFNTTKARDSETNTFSTYRAFGGAASVMGAGFYALGKDPRDIKHNDHQAQMALNPKRSYRDSKSTRWTTI